MTSPNHLNLQKLDICQTNTNFYPVIIQLPSHRLILKCRENGRVLKNGRWSSRTTRLLSDRLSPWRFRRPRNGHLGRFPRRPWLGRPWLCRAASSPPEIFLLQLTLPRHASQRTCLCLGCCRCHLLTGRQTATSLRWKRRYLSGEMIKRFWFKPPAQKQQLLN